MDEFADLDRPRKRSKHLHTDAHSNPYHHSHIGATDDAFVQNPQYNQSTNAPGHLYSSTDRMTSTMPPGDGLLGNWAYGSSVDDAWSSVQLNAPFSSEGSVPHAWPSSSGADSALPVNDAFHPDGSSSYQDTPQQPTQFPDTTQHSSALPHPSNQGHRHAGPGNSQQEARRTQRSPILLVSPFKDCLDSFGTFGAQRFPRPLDGRVDGYVKFNWPTGRRPPSSQKQGDRIVEVTDDGDTFDHNSGLYTFEQSSVAPASTVQSENGQREVVFQYSHNLSPATTFSSPANPATSPHSFDVTPSFTFDWSPTTNFVNPWTSSNGGQVQAQPSMGNPKLVPESFGLEAKMSRMDRQLWDFYILNWCPGRSVLKETNLWEKDFGSLQRSEGVRAAIQSLAGIYVYDYTRNSTLLRVVNHKFAIAEARLDQLLNNSSSLKTGKGSEVITLAVILSMQDVVLTERRLKKPHLPRWLQGFRQGEYFLDHTDTGSRYWNKNHVQLDSLGLSQAIIVGRAVILAQPMMPLPSAADFDPSKEIKRFGWLLYGSKKEMYEIHGGCGFSKKLLHLMSQITYCAARLNQEPDSPIVPMTADYLLQELQEMRQWSRESRTWEDAKEGWQVIQAVKEWPEGYVLSSSAEMTDVTAEVWRITAIIYLQCRVLRLPRTDPAVVQNLSDLAVCVRVMPTSGSVFTAQAPLFPVFMLGMVATVPEQKKASEFWFEQVVQTPVRSSVPPLYEVLKRLWMWIETELEEPHDQPLPQDIGMRFAWWEVLVSRVEEREEETLCLT